MNKINNTIHNIKNKIPNLLDLFNNTSQEEELNLKLKIFNQK
ncbi:hypothetical protein [Candidatus Legionella polyplacis]|nr:hypothetical protein [Candidatus Legionella polyplacis]